MAERRSAAELRGSAPHAAGAVDPRPNVLRAVLLGLMLLTLLVLVTPYDDYFVPGSYMASHHVPLVGTFVLFALATRALRNPGFQAGCAFPRRQPLSLPCGRTQRNTRALGPSCV